MTTDRRDRLRMRTSPPPPARSTLPVLAALLAVAAATTAAAPGALRIQRGDTLSELALRHGTTVAALRAANGLAPDAPIYAGRTLLLRAPAAEPTSGTAEQTHTVAEGENVTLIARRYGASVGAVLRRNQLPGNGLVLPGRLLSIPVPAAAAALPPAATRPGSVGASAAQHRETLAASALPSKAEARRVVAATARRYGVDVSLALSVAYHESGFQMRVVSPVDAIGVMQVLPSTGRDMERLAGRPLDLLRLEDNATAGVLLLRSLLRSTGAQDEALAGYYQGLGSVARKGRLPQTEQYLKNIAALRDRFADG